ncbi:non-ribosomal peptide synthetase [Acanthopleuribacter pedis]|uniref:Amino acid adenylation domain-containing protein n=1 Tax=Acanthopleuribacter pedis TaxID=442870 RepID=A0A8J7Q433_9BACT|nr:non-ribosomal peptide synthetase [Acanthopleuribacter pedis]MBO1317919.1 amino acid adenylation domain-containing protein [Acanthopleuribacter pedis]
MATTHHLTHGQHELWLDQQLHESGVPFHIGAAIEFKGPLQTDLLVAATRAAIRNHDCIRLMISFDGNVPRQQPCPDFDPPIPLHDFSETADPRQAVFAAMAADQAQPLAEGAPPVRFAVYRLGPEHHVWYSLFHHMVADGWGWFRVMGYLMQAYNRLKQGAAPPPQPPAFLDQVARDAAYRRSPRFDRAREHWQARLAALPEAVDLAESVDLRTERVAVAWPRDRWQQLCDCAKSIGVSPFQVFTGLVGVYLGRAFRADALTLSLPVLNRGSAVAKHTAGLFIAEKPLALGLGEGTGFRALVLQLARDLRRDYRHGAFPLSALARRGDGMSRLGRFNVSYMEHRYSEGIHGCSHQVHQLVPPMQPFALALSVRDFAADAPISLDFNYQPALLRRGFIEDMAAGLDHLLDCFTADPDIAVTVPNPLPTAILMQREKAWNRGVPAAAPVHFVTALRRAAARNPGAPALWAENQVISHGAFDRVTDRLASQLRQGFGVGPEVPVAVQAGGDADSVIAMVAVFKAGGVLVPLEPDHPPARRQRMLEIAVCRLVLGEDPRDARPGITLRSVTALLDGAEEGEAPAVTELLHSAYLLFTSGSTGMPKCCRIAHAQFGNWLAWSLALYRDCDDGFHDVLHGSMTFDARLGSVLLSLAAGGSLTLPPADLDGVSALRWVCTHENPADVLDLTPTHLELLVGMGVRNGRVRRIVCTGEVLKPDLLAAAAGCFPNARIYNQYGPTEATVGCSAAAFGVGERIHLGATAHGTGLYVLDAHGRPVPRGFAGELVIGGAGVCHGYDGLPGRTASVFVPDPFAENQPGRLYRTGDLVRRADDGTFDFLGRMDNQLKIKGQRIEPEEIEAVLRRHDAVQNAAVLPYQRGEDKVLVAFVTPSVVDEQALRDHAVRRLTPAMVPAYFVPVDQLPTTTSGKTDRGALAARLADLEPAAGNREAVAPRNDKERALAELCCSVLARQRVDMGASFLELGGDSLAAVRLAAAAERRLGWTLRVRAILRCPDLATLAGLADDSAAGPAAVRPAPVAVEGSLFPLTPGQEALWFHQKRNGDAAAYHMPGTLDLRGRLNKAALAAALETLQHRHEALRMRIQEQDGVALQRFVSTTVALEARDCSDAEAAAAWVRQRTAAPFDLTREAPLRTTLLRLGDEHHQLVLVFHHIACDGHALERFFAELKLLYNGAVAGKAALLEPTSRWRDWVVSLHDQVPSQATHDYWRGRLAEFRRPDLPLDRPRPARPDFHGARHQVRLPALVVTQLKQIAQPVGGGIFAAFSALVRLLLCRLTGEDDQALGTPYLGRDQQTAADVFGYFVTNLVLRGRVAAADSFRALIAAEVETISEALAFPPPALERLAESLAMFPEPGRTPFFDVMVVYETNLDLGFSLDGLATAIRVAPLPAAKMDLTFAAMPEGDGSVLVNLIYRDSLFDAARIEAMGADLLFLAESVAAGPALPVGRHLAARAAQTAGAEDRLFSRLDGGPSPVGNETVVDLFERAAALYPDQPAVSDATRRLTYTALDQQANGLATYLVEVEGVGPEDRIGLLCHPGVGQIMGVLGILKAGAAYVPLDPDYPRERLQFMVDDAGPRVLVCDASTRALAADLAGRPGICYDVGSPKHSPPRVLRHPQQATFLIYTSGTTGRPKAAIQNHRGFANIITARARDFGLGPGDVYPNVLSFSYDAAQLTSFTPLVCGAALYCAAHADREDPERLHRLLVREKATHLVAPTAYFALLQDLDVPSLRVLISGGEAPEPRRVRAYLKRYQYMNDYGPCEASVLVCRHGVSLDDDLENGVPLGTPPAGVRLYLVDDRLRLVAPGRVGEIAVGGVAPGRGYHRRPKRTAACWRPDPYGDEAGARLYLTGDFAVLRGGRLHFRGRRDDQVKIRGNRVELGEVERRLGSVPGVGSAAVIARATPGGSKELVAYYTVVEGGDPKPREALRRLLPEPMIPAFFVVLDRFPLTANGKINRRALPQPETVEVPLLQAPHDALETEIAATWARVLHLPAVGRDQNFFELGGQSLSAMRVAALLRRALGRETTMRDLFERPVLADLAERLRGRVPLREMEGPSALKAAEDYPLSHAQKRLWVLHRMGGGETAYNMPGLFLLEGPLDVAALERAFQALFARHEALRTVFVMRKGEPRQRVLPAHGFLLKRLDLRARANPEDEAHRLGRRDAVTPFDLETGPLMRATLMHVAPERFVLAVCLHHLICDGWSLRLMTRELFDFYGKPEDAAPLSIHYKDVAAWRAARLAAGDGNESRRYWHGRFAEPPPHLALVTDQPRAAATRFDGARIAIPLDPELGRRLRQTARAHHIGPFVLLQALVKVLLFRHTGQTDLVIGAPVAGRDHVRLDNQVGFYVNMLPLRDQLDPDASFGQLLLTARERAAEAFSHQAYPFDLLVEELSLPRDSGREPLFDVVVAYEESEETELRLPDVRVTPQETAVPAGKFELTFGFVSERDGLIGSLEFSRALFDTRRMTALARQFVSLARAVVAGDERPLKRLPLEDAAALQRAVADGRGTRRVWPADAALTARLVDWAQQAPARPAVFADDGRLDYRCLMERAGRLAAALVGAGMGAEQRVAVLVHRGCDLPVAWIGVWLSGAVLVPLDPEGDPALLGRLWRQAGCRLLVCNDGGAETAARVAGAAVVNLAQTKTHPVLAKPALRFPAGAAYVMFTSGTTGGSKGVVVPNRAVTNLLANYQHRYFARLAQTGLRVASFSPSFFDPSIALILAPLAYGHQLCLTGEREIGDVRLAADFLRRHQVQVVDSTPSFLAAVQEAGGLPASCRLIITGGEALQPATAARLGAGAEVHNAYGPTEACVDALSFRIEAGETLPEIPIGTPLDNVETYVLDDDGLLCPQGAVGELCIGGAGLARGYLDRPRETAAAFVPHPFRNGERLYRSGDLARLRSDGQILFLGRRDGQIKRNGVRMELGQIEEGLLRLPGVSAAAAALIARPGEETQLVAYVVLPDARNGVVPENQTRVRAWRAALAAFLPRFMIPGVFVTVPSLPRAATGKLDRAALPVPERIASGGEPPRDTLETRLCALWRDVLACGTVGIFDDFYRLGGQSLKALRLAARVAAELGLELGLAEILAHPTVAEQADLLRQRTERDQTAIPKQPDAATYPVSHAQQRMWVLDRLDPFAYQMPAAYECLGLLDVTALEKAFTAVVARHESLRTTFTEQDGEPRQRVHAPARQRIALTQSSPDDLAGHVDAFLQQPFDPAVGPLLRVHLVCLNARRHLLLVSLHHIVADAWSIGVLAREVSLAYAAFRNDQTPALPALTLQHRDFSAFARAQIEEGALDQARDFWLATLRGDLPVLALPADQTRPARQSFAGGRCQAVIDTETTHALTELAARSQVTPFMVAATLAFVLLQRHSGQDEILAGVPVSGRDHLALENQMGLYLNTLVLRAHLHADLPFLAALDQVAEVFARAVEHRAYPFDLLVEGLDAARDLSRSPVFQAMMVLQDAEDDVFELDGLRTRPFPINFDKAKCDVTFFFRFEDGYLHLDVEYAAFLGDTRMQRFTEQFCTLLAAAVRRPEQAIGRLPLLDAAQREAVIAATDRRHTRANPDVVDLFEARRKRSPQTAAVVMGETTWSYQELDARVQALAAQLVAQGVGSEDVVGVALPRGTWLPAALLAVLRVGAIYLPLDAGYPAERLRRVVAHTGCRHLIAFSAPDWAGSALTVVAPQVAPTEAVPISQVEPDQVAYLISTSGSTGTPKVVACTRRCLAQLISWNLAELGAAHRVLAYAPLGFDVSLQEQLVTLCGGGTLHFTDETTRRDISLLAERLIRDRISMITMPFSALALLGDVLEDRHVPDLRALCTSGEALQRTRALDKLLARHPELVLHNQYGPSETHVITAGAVGGDDPAAAPIGAPIDGNAVYLLDANLEPVPPGVAGELYLAGEGLARGYWGDPTQTATRFLPDPFGPAGSRMYRSGDRGCLLPDGRLAFLGRADDQVKIRGFRVEPAEVSRVLRDCDGVREVVTVGVTVGGSCELAAYVVGPDAAAVPRLNAALRERLPAFMVPAFVMPLAALPRLPSGKIHVRALPRPEVAAAPSGVSRPGDALEKQLCRLWSRMLGRGTVGLDDDFFAAGGHSLKAMQLVAALRKELVADVTLADLFEAPSPAAFAQRLRGRRPARYAPLPAAGARSHYPLSPGQRRLWLLARLVPDTAAYHVPVALHLRGPLNEAALVAALADVATRHAVLRTRFPADGDTPVQVVDPPGPVPLRRRGQLEGDLTAAFAGWADQPFDLAEQHPFRVDLVSCGEAEHGLLLCFHHIATDGWSLKPLADDLAACYQARCKGEEPRLPSLPIQVTDVAVFQSEQAADGTFAAQADFWRRRLGSDTPPAFAGDHPRPERCRYEGETFEFTLSDADHAAVHRVAQAEGLTPFVVLLGAFQLLLAGLNGGRVPRIGTPVANRDREELAGLIGFFVNTLVLNTHIEPGESGRVFLHRLRGEVSEAFAHRDLPFEQLVELLQPERDPSRHPLFDISFAYQGNQTREGRWGDVAWRALEVPHQTTKYDLNLSLVACDGVLVGNLEYARALFEPATIKGFARRFQTLLRGLCADMGRAAVDLPLLEPEEERRILTAAGNPVLPEPTVLGIHRLFEEQAARVPHRIALTHEGRHLSYADLDQRANQWAHVLVAAGVGPETLVALLIEPAFETLVAILAVLKAGGAYVPLDPRQPEARQRVMLADAQPLLLLHHGVASESIPTGSWRVMDLATPPADSATQAPEATFSPDQAAYVIYTSGSTGRPKGVVVAHRQVLQLFTAADALFKFDENDVWTLFHATSFDFSVWELWGALIHGARLVIVPYWVGRTPRRFLELLRGERVSVLSQTPSAFTQLAALETETPLAPTEQPRYVVFGGESLDVSSVHAWLRRHPEGGPSFINMYGITETCVHVTFQKVDGNTPQGAVGRAMPHLATLVCDTAGKLLPFGRVGEILVAGGGLARGYLNQAALTAQRFQPHPHATRPGERIYRSGDLGILHADGTLIHRGRADSQVQIRGYRIEPGEVRAALLDLPGVRDAAVIARDGAEGPELVAYLQTKDPTAPLERDPREALNKVLPAYMVPTWFVTLAELPLTANGKLATARLPAPEAGRDNETEFVAPRGECERWIASVWEDVLGVGRVGRNDDFFALGGHSLAAARVLHRIQAGLGIDVPLRAFFDAPTLAHLAARVGEVAGEAVARDTMLGIPIPTRCDGLVFPATQAQKRMWFLAQIEDQTLAYNMPHAVQLVQGLDPTALVAAVTALVTRHHGLRVLLRFENGVLHQHLAPPASVRPSFPVFPRAGGETWSDWARRWCEQQAHRPFDLAAEAPFRVAYLRNPKGADVLFLNLHHSAGDGWSMGLIVRELADFYRLYRETKGDDQALARIPEPLQITAFSGWQAALSDSPRLQRQRDFWLDRLQPLAPPLALPLDRPRPAVRTYRGDRRHFIFSTGRQAALNTLARRHKTGLFSLLAAVVKTLLFRYSGQTDFVLGTPVAARPHPRLEGLVGCLVNTLPLRDPFQADMAFSAFLEQTRSAVLAMLDHQLYPFEQLVDDLGLARDTTRPVLFDVMLVMQNADFEPPNFAAGEIRDFPFDFRTAKFDLLFNFWEAEDGLHLNLEFHTDLFEPTRIDRVFTHLNTLFEAVVRAPETPLSRLPLLAADEQRLLRQWSRGPCAEHRPRLIDAFVEQVATRPNQAALIYNEFTLTYRQVDAWSAQLARSLRARGVREGDIVAVNLPREVPVAVALMAVLRLGATYAYLDPSDPDLRRRRFLEDVAPKAVITYQSDDSTLADTAVLRIGEQAPATRPDWDDVVAAPDQAAYLIYTSGSTGQPKAVLGTYRCLENLIAWQRATMGDGLRGLGFAALGFDVSVQEMLFALLSGGTLVNLDTTARLDMAGIAATIERYQIALAVMPYTPLSLFVRENETLPQCLRWLVTSGERLRLDPILRRHLKANPNLVLHNQYGPSETHVVTAEAVRGTDPGLPDFPPIGTPLNQTLCLVLDGAGEPVPMGVPGELFLGGDHLALGYHGRPRLTASVFVPAPTEAGLPAGARLYRTGDRCIWQPDGSLQFLGRADDQVKIRGFRVEPGEVTAVLGEHPAVSEAAVISVRRNNHNRLHAYFVPSKPVSDRELRTWLGKRLPAHMVPEAYAALDALPMNANGKLDPGALPQALAVSTTGGGEVPVTGTARRIAAVWEKVLGVAGVGLTDAFFELGGNSFSLIEVHHQLKALFGEPLPVVKLFEHTTIAALAAYLDHRVEEQPRRVSDRGRARRSAAQRRRR